MKITLHSPHGPVTFRNCMLLPLYEVNGPLPTGYWLRFKGTTDMGNQVTILTSLPAEIYELTNSPAS